jgi:hypothetical protein
MKWTAGDVQQMNSGHGFNIIPAEGLPVPLLSLVYENTIEADKARKFVKTALDRAISVVAPAR